MSEVWKSQAWNAEGSTDASGILNQLGRPDLDEFTVLVREAAQNSWDARRGDRDVDFTIRVERLGGRAEAWRRRLLPGPAEESVRGFALGLTADSWCLTVSDRGTHGLGGPLRATERPAPGERNDFVQFMRNVGEPRDHDLGGGTYGFGKGIFYRTSRVKTVLADSRVETSAGAGFERRVMGAALGEPFWPNSGTRFTGRHWWGRIVDDVIDPVTGSDAEAIAADLGLPGYEGDATGTNIVVVGADLGLLADDPDGSVTASGLAEHMASAILWNLWPKFRSVAEPATTAMTFSVVLEGEQIPIPSPDEVQVLKPFVQAFKAIGSPDKSYRRASRPKIHAGDLAVRVAPVGAVEGVAVTAARPFAGVPHHVARMRQAGLVVDYFPGPVCADPVVGYGGVFMATAASDTNFAKSEPPTHDRWSPEGLDAESKAVVQGAQRWLREQLSKQFGTASGQASGKTTQGMGQGSRRLAGLVAGVSSTGADPRGNGGGGGGSGGGARRKPGARIIGDPQLATSGEVLGVRADVAIDEAASVDSVTAHLDVVVDGGKRETNAPAGANAPRVLGWAATGDPSVIRKGPRLTDLVGIDRWTVFAQFTDSAVTRFRLEVEVVDDGA